VKAAPGQKPSDRAPLLFKMYKDRAGNDHQNPSEGCPTFRQQFHQPLHAGVQFGFDPQGKPMINEGGRNETVRSVKILSMLARHSTSEFQDACASHRIPGIQQQSGSMPRFQPLKTIM
jgi:hypothetical protein